MDPTYSAIGLVFLAVACGVTIALSGWHRKRLQQKYGRRPAKLEDYDDLIVLTHEIEQYLTSADHLQKQLRRQSARIEMSAEERIKPLRNAVQRLCSEMEAHRKSAQDLHHKLNSIETLVHRLQEAVAKQQNAA